MINMEDKLIEVKIKAIEDLYNKFKEIYEKDSRLHDGQWRCGSPKGMEEMYAYKRALEIMKTDNEEDVESIKDMDILDFWHKFVREE